MSQLSPKLGMSAAAPNQRKHWIELSDLNWGWVFLLYIAVGLISAGSVFTAGLASGGHQPYYFPLIWEMTGFCTAFLTLPLIVFALSRLPITRENWIRTLPMHLVFSMVYGAANTGLMYLSRQAIYHLLGWGSYDYGHFGYRLVMEYHKQFLHYVLVYALLRGLALYRESREQERAAAALELRASELQRQLGDARLQALRSQLNPHFLFNTLNMISSVMYEDCDRADHMIAALSRMLRMSLEDVGPEVPLQRELDFLEAMGQLLKARFGKGQELEIACAPRLSDVPVPSMLLHTLVENAIKHHTNPGESGIRIRVGIEENDGFLRMRVLDNGPGIPDLNAAFGKGVGLANMRERLRALYGDNQSIQIRNRPEGGLDVQVTLPMRARPALQLQPA
jgi:signal transduction histidine kinase